jgi:cell division septation protein DedD
LDQRNIRVDFESAQNQVLKMEDLKDNQPKKQNSDETYFIQVGIFSNANNAKKIAKKVGDIGFKTRLLPLVLDGQNKIQLVTSSFDNRGNANIALAKIKEAKLPGMIKQRFN